METELSPPLLTISSMGMAGLNMLHKSLFFLSEHWCERPTLGWQWVVVMPWHSLPINAHPQTLSITVYHSSDSKIQGANVGPTWGRQGPPWVARTRVGPTLVTQTLLSVSEFGCLLPTTEFHGLILKLFENPIFNLLFLIKDPWRKKKREKNQNSTSTAFWAILLCAFKPNIGKIG